MGKLRETSRRLIVRTLVAPEVSRRVEVPPYEQQQRERRPPRCHRSHLGMERSPSAPVEVVLQFSTSYSLELGCSCEASAERKLSVIRRTRARKNRGY